MNPKLPKLKGNAKIIDECNNEMQKLIAQMEASTKEVIAIYEKIRSVAERRDKR